MKVTIQSPQFNQEQLKPGIAIFVVKDPRAPGSRIFSNKFSKSCLVVSCTPLELTVAYVGETQEGHTKPHVDTLIIQIGEVSAGQYEITGMLKEPEEVTKESVF